jgi:hypothetical protein
MLAPAYTSTNEQCSEQANKRTHLKVCVRCSPKMFAEQVRTMFACVRFCSPARATWCQRRAA